MVPFAQACVPLEDRGLQFGESLYEVVALLKGCPFRLPDHVARIRAGADELGLGDGVPAEAQWQAIISALFEHTPLPEALLYAQLTGGTAPRQHVPPLRPKPSFFAYVRAYDFPGEQEIRAGTTAVTLTDPRWHRRNLKTTMLLPAVLARQQALSQGAQEAIFVGDDGLVNEGAASTVFALLDGVLCTPPCNERILAGVSTIAVCAVCRELGIPCLTRPISIAELRRAPELLLASTNLLLMPITRLDGAPVGSGKPGPTSLAACRRFLREFRRSARR